jgi:hypothetical protein
MIVTTTNGSFQSPLKKNEFKKVEKISGKAYPQTIRRYSSRYRSVGKQTLEKKTNIYERLRVAYSHYKFKTRESCFGGKHL